MTTTAHIGTFYINAKGKFCRINPKSVEAKDGSIYTRDDIERLLNTDETFMACALVRIYEEQTATERQTESVQVSNDVGFSQNDVVKFSRIAEYVLRTGRLTQSMVAELRAPGRFAGRSKIGIYAAQLLWLGWQEELSRKQVDRQASFEKAQNLFGRAA